MMSDKKNPRPATAGSVRKEFTPATNAQVEDVHEFEHKIALSFPQELSRKEFQLQFVLDHFDRLGVIKGDARTRNLVSHYFDTEDGHLYKQGLALRVRYEEDPKTGVTLSRPDVSIKNKGHSVGGTTLRDEYESKLDLHANGTVKPILSLRPMIEKYGNKWAKTFGKLMSLNFKDYREVFSINCRRTTFKVCLYSLTDPATNQITIKPASDLSDQDRKTARKLIYEFALDANRFFVPGATAKVKKDYEIEFELKTHDCEYDPNPDSSDHGVTLKEAMAGRDWIRTHVEKLLHDRHLTPITETGMSKSERGELYRRNAGFDTPLYDHLTMRGRDDSFVLPKSLGRGRKPSNDNGDEPQRKSGTDHTLRP